MDLEWLESFVVLAQYGSFTQAAAAQHLSQSAFSRRIRALERWLGAELIDRSSYPVVLTEVGVELRARAGDLLAGIAAVRDEIRGRRLIPRDAVRISVTHTLAVSFFAQWWNRGTAPCTLLAASTLDAYDSLISGESELVLAYSDPEHPLETYSADVSYVVAGYDRLAPYTRSRDGDAVFELPGSPDEPVPLLAHRPDTFFGRVTNRLTAAADLHVTAVVQSDLTAALARLALAGTGIAWLPERLIADDVRAGLLAEVGGPDLCAELEIRLYRDERRPLSRHAAAMWDREGSSADPMASRRAALPGMASSPSPRQ